MRRGLISAFLGLRRAEVLSRRQPRAGPRQGHGERADPLGRWRLSTALLECVIGACLISGRGVRRAVYLLGIQLAGILSPLVLFAPRLFSGPHHAPTLEGQYVLKDIILVGATLVIAATVRGGTPQTPRCRARHRSSHRAQKPAKTSNAQPDAAGSRAVRDLPDGEADDARKTSPSAISRPAAVGQNVAHRPQVSRWTHVYQRVTVLACQLEKRRPSIQSAER